MNIEYLEFILNIASAIFALLAAIFWFYSANLDVTKYMKITPVAKILVPADIQTYTIVVVLVTLGIVNYYLLSIHHTVSISNGAKILWK